MCDTLISWEEKVCDILDEQMPRDMPEWFEKIRDDYYRIVREKIFSKVLTEMYVEISETGDSFKKRWCDDNQCDEEDFEVAFPDFGQESDLGSVIIDVLDCLQFPLVELVEQPATSHTGLYQYEFVMPNGKKELEKIDQIINDTSE